MQQEVAMLLLVAAAMPPVVETTVWQQPGRPRMMPAGKHARDARQQQQSGMPLPGGASSAAALARTWQYEPPTICALPQPGQ